MMNKNSIQPPEADTSVISYYASHVAPFLLFFLFIYLGPLLNIPKWVLYPLQTVIISGILVFYWGAYKDEIRFSLDWIAIIAGVAVFFIWVLPEGLYPQLSTSEFNPYELTTGNAVFVLIAFRLIGASLVVPLAEEIFWRSFALRFLIRSDFKAVPLGRFSWFSFVMVSIAFGLEHHRWLPGIVAGLIYAGVLYRTKNLLSPILAHAVTNFLLGVYVLATGQWDFW